jgi:5-methylcytosine-specific restriction endonuclease McrA
LDYAVKRLHYPYDQAWRRIEAMRLMKEVPEIESKISEGSLNLTNIGYAQAAFKAEAKKSAPLAKERKLEFLQRIENQSTRATQKLVAEEFGNEVLVRETVKPITATTSMMNLVVPQELVDVIDELKCSLAHANPRITTSELLLKVCKEKLDAIKSKKESRVAAPRKCDVGGSHQLKNTRSGGRYIPASVNRAIWAKDNSKCSNCGSHYALECDHQIPFGKNGKSSQRNLRLLCRNCNQRAAIEEYGLKKMSRFLREPNRI